MITLIAVPFIATIIFAVTILLIDKKMKIKGLLKFSFFCLAICSVISVGGYFLGIGHAYNSEIWDLKGVSIKHETEWTTKESRTYTRGSGKNAKTVTEHYTEKHGPYWTLKNDRGDETNISESEYNRWKSIWGFETKIGEHHGSAAFLGTKIDGQIFQCEWNGAFDKIMPLSEIHSYLNKVRASKYSVLKYKEVSEKIKENYPRPADCGKFDGIFNYGANVSITEDDMLLMRRTNAFLGSRYQIHPIYMLFDSTVGMSIVDDIIAAWEGPNKNELVVFVGVEKDSKKMSWIKVESWMDDTTINGCITDLLLNKPFVARTLSNALRETVPTKWHRKKFADFDYLELEISFWCICLAVLLEIMCAVIMIFVYDDIVNNSSGNVSRNYARSYFRRFR